MTFRWVNGKLVDLEDHPKMMERWVREDKRFDVGDKVIILDKSHDKSIVGYEWDSRFDKLIGRTRTIERRVINYYGYLCGYKLKNCPGYFSPDFLMRKGK